MAVVVVVVVAVVVAVAVVVVVASDDCATFSFVDLNLRKEDREESEHRRPTIDLSHNSNILCLQCGSMHGNGIIKTAIRR